MRAPAATRATDAATPISRDKETAGGLKLPAAFRRSMASAPQHETPRKVLEHNQG